MLAIVGSAHAGLIDLGTLGGTTSQAWGVRSDGTVVVGSSLNATAQTQAFVYNVNAGFTGGTMTALNFLAGGTAAEARAVNSGGLIVGYSRDGGAIDQAVTWTGTNVSLITNNLGGAGARALGVSNAGLVVGWARQSTGSVQRAFVSTGSAIDSGDALNLSALNGQHDSNVHNSRALGISANGRFVVGEYEVDNGAGGVDVRGFVIDRTTPGNSYEFVNGSVASAKAANGTTAVGSFFDAGQVQTVAAYTTHSTTSSDYLAQAAGGAGVAYGINASNAVVGSQDLGIGFRAVLWDTPSIGATVTDMNTMHSTANVLTESTGIADVDGIYTGNGTFGGQLHAFLLAVPEPSSAALVLPLLALAPLALRRKRSA